MHAAVASAAVATAVAAAAAYGSLLALDTGSILSRIQSRFQSNSLLLGQGGRETAWNLNHSLALHEHSLHSSSLLAVDHRLHLGRIL